MNPNQFKDKYAFLLIPAVAKKDVIDPNKNTVNNTIKQFLNSISTGYASDVEGTQRKGKFF